MITKEENKIERICSFYASDFHLEMIIMPYIKRKINENTNIVVITQRDLSRTIEILVSRVNFDEDTKQKILNLNWKNETKTKIKSIEESRKKEQIIFIVGDRNYIKETNENIKNLLKTSNAKIIDCYDLSEVAEEMTEIVASHSKVLNTIEEKDLN